MSDYLSLDPNALPLQQTHGHLLGAVGPRPIAFASTVDAEGRPNLAPFSYFNVFSTRPPVLVFSPNRSGRTGQHKDTVLNLHEVPEVVVNVVTRSMVEQVNLASTEYPRGVSEFAKAGFTALASEVVKPARVAESPVQLECTVRQIIELADTPGSGNLVICDIVRIHLHTQILDANGRIDPRRIDLVGRMGGDWYAHANGEALFTVSKPSPQGHGMGIDALPEAIRRSALLTGNDLAQLANLPAPPTAAEVAATLSAHPEISADLGSAEARHRFAHALLAERQVAQAWAVLLG